jgi:outer membrane protein insertion porin family
MVTAVALPINSAIAAASSKVARIVITGNENINKETIENVIKLVPGTDYTDEAVDKDRAAINGLGYFSAVSVRTEDTPEGLSVIYDVVENQIVRSIEIVGAAPISKETVQGLMRTRTSKVLNTETLNLDIDAIQRYYRDEGYFAYVTEDIGIDRDSGALTIPILVNTIESVDIMGNKKTKDYVLLREMKSKPGAYFNTKTLHDDIVKIWNLDVFESVQPPQREPGSQVGKINVVIPVTEKKTGNFNVGVGYSSRSKLVGKIELMDSNFRGKGQGLNLLWETGTSGGIGGPSSYEIGFHEPWIDKNHTSLSVNAFNKLLYRFSNTILGGNGDFNGRTYSERRKGGTLGFSRPFNQFTRGFVTFRGETVETSNLTSLTDVDVGRFLGQSGPVQSGTFRLVNNTRDFDRDPGTGLYKSMSLEMGRSNVTEHTMGAGNLIVDTPVEGPFGKLQFDLRGYWSKGGRKENPNDKRTTIAARLLAGVSTGDLPFFEQFFMGGAESLRGYREDRFWGTKMVLASLEYRRPVAQSMTGVLFVDCGDAWGGPDRYKPMGGAELTQHSGFEANFGAGIGMRVNTPIGNLRLDYALLKSAGGPSTSFSIGQAF